MKKILNYEEWRKQNMDIQQEAMDALRQNFGLSDEAIEAELEPIFRKDYDTYVQLNGGSLT